MAKIDPRECPKKATRHVDNQLCRRIAEGRKEMSDEKVRGDELHFNTENTLQSVRRISDVTSS